MSASASGPDPAPRELRRLARLYGVECEYRDVSGGVRAPSTPALLHVLQALRAPVERLTDVAEAVRARRAALSARSCDPVTVVWLDGGEAGPGGGRRGPIRLRLDDARSRRRAGFRLRLESGEEMSGALDLSPATVRRGPPAGERRMVSLTAHLPESVRQILPCGYHRLAVEIDGGRWETLLIVAPTRVASVPSARGRAWGVFLPLFALHSRGSVGIGDLSDLAELAEWAASHGASFVGTLPLLATHLDAPVRFSPYSPASRLFWNEIHLDLRSIPEMHDCADARCALDGAIAVLDTGAREIDYDEVAGRRRVVLQALADHFFDHGSEARHGELEEFLSLRPDVAAYARFRAATEACGREWWNWSDSQVGDARSAHALSGEAQTLPLPGSPATRYHLYAQWQCHEQMNRIATRCNASGISLYLDLPVGAPPSSFDAWLYRDHFVDGCTAGAPPDGFFEDGQTWGFAPLRPEALRESGYRYWIDGLRHHMAACGILRVDHVMGLHRMYCVPDGHTADDGVYLRYAAEEMYAVLAIESARSGCAVIGEDLGTVPRSVRTAMRRHGVLRTHVAQGQPIPGGVGSGADAPAESLTCLGTHDMPPFAAYWIRALGIDDLQDPRARESAMAAMHDALRGLAAGPARLVQVNLDDLWGETDPHNVPGTHGSRANWSRRSRYSLERIRESDDVVRILDEVDRLRRRAGGDDG